MHCFSTIYRGVKASGEVWIGMKNAGGWSWLGGGPISYQLAAPDLKSKCGAVDESNSLHDRPCNNTARALCEKTIENWRNIIPTQ